MNQITRLTLIFCFCLLSFSLLQAQQPTEKINLPTQSILQNLDQLRSLDNVNISLPTLVDPQVRFSVSYRPLYQADFEQRFPQHRTYRIRNIESGINGFLVTDGKHLFVSYHSPQGIYFLRHVKGTAQTYHFEKLTEQDLMAIECGVHDDDTTLSIDLPENAAGMSYGATDREYRIAIVSTGEYFVANGNTLPAVTNEINSALAALNTIYNNEMAVSFIHAAGSPVVYQDTATDPFIPDQLGGKSRTRQAANAVEMNFSSGVYDIGHALHNSSVNPGWSGGGVAFRPAACNNNQINGEIGRFKGGGWSGSFNNQTNSFYGLFSHEIGHMLNATHTFNANSSNCAGGNYTASTSYEIASGVTIMSYRGICSPQNVPFSLPAYNIFHTNSQTRMNTYVSSGTGSNCDNPVASGNTPPTVNANPCGGSHSIPISTPFTLTGSGSDVNAPDILTYIWEQYDVDASGNSHGDIGSDAANSTVAPMFRNYLPVSEPSRTIPEQSLLLANDYTSDYEHLPAVARTLNFHFTVRDNSSTGTGGVACDDLAISVTSDGPLSVTSPNDGTEQWTPGGTETVTWVVNGTNAICTNVRILLSLDGGNTYTDTLATSTPNDGSEMISISSTAPNTTQARIKVECADNNCVTFFDLSDNDFDINAQNCRVANSALVDITNETFPLGSPNLDFDPKIRVDTTASEVIFTVSAADPNMTDTYLSGSSCATASGTDNYQSFRFYTDNGGTFFGSFEGGNFSQLNTYETEFDVSNTCTNFLHSTRTTAGGTCFNGIQDPRPVFTAGSCYELIATDRCGGSFTLIFGGSYNVFPFFTSPTNTSYTFAVVNTATGLIEAVDASANFTSLGIGNYELHGINYKSGGAAPPAIVNPFSLIGQTIANANANNCLISTTNFKPFSVTAAQPVEWLAFTAQKEEDAVQLNWTVQELPGSMFFELQHTTDGTEWSRVELMRSKGARSEPNSYSHAHIDYVNGLNYYRVLQYDRWGAQRQSEIRVVNITENNSSRLVSLFPNPTSGQLNLRWRRGVEQAQVSLFDMQGRRLQDYADSQLPNQLDVQALPAGSYILRIVSDVESVVLRFVKE